MASQILIFQPTIPANIAASAPYTMDMSFPAMTVDRIDVMVPDGPNGAVGFAIGAAGQPVIPFQSGQWIIANNETLSFPLEGFWDSGSWEFFGYNIGNFQHTLYVRFYLSRPAKVSASSLIVPIAPSIIGSPSDLIPLPTVQAVTP